MADAADLLGVLSALLLAAATLTLPAAAAAAATRRWWRHSPALAPAWGLLGTGLAGLAVFFAWVLAPTAGAVVGWAVALGSTLWLVRVTVRGRASLPGCLAAAAPVVLVTAGLLLGTTGLFLLWGWPADLFHLARVRFTAPMPNDNEIPALLAARLQAGEDPRTAVTGWLSSDRPPLQSGLLLLVHAVVGRWGPAEGVQAFATGVVAQLAWAPVAYALCRALGSGRRPALVAVLFTGASGSVLVNTVFTWPKLLSAGFVLAALALAVDLRGRTGRSTAPLTAIAMLSALALLSHGAGLFALPVLAVLLWQARRSTRLTDWAVAGLAALAVYVPWLAYQRWYDPPGDRLLKWHLAGVIEPDDRSFVTALREEYGQLSWSAIVDHKLQNLAFPFSVPPWGTLQVDDVPPGQRSTQFFTITGAVGLGTVPLALLAAVAVATWLRHRGPTTATRSAGILAAAFAGIVLWALAMFGPGTTYVHQGTHVPLLLAGVLPVAWLAGRGSLGAAASAALLAAQTVLLLIVYLPTDSPGPLHVGSLSVALLGTAACVIGTLSARARGSDRTRADPPSAAATPASPRTAPLQAQPPLPAPGPHVTR